MQASSACKLKYAYELFWQLHIINNIAAHPILQELYLANVLVNLRGSLHTFYKMDLFLEYQNSEFKLFKSNSGSSFQETNQMFRLHTLSVDTIAKITHLLNRVIKSQERNFIHPIKDALFDIMSLADQLH